MRLLGLIPHLPLALCAVLFAAHESLAECEPWPGEPSPLPTVSSSDGLSARFAHLRADELAALALELESVAPGDAYRVWLHVACLDPEREDARGGVKRTAPVRVHTPEVVQQRAPATAAAPDVVSALGRLDDPIIVVLATRGSDAAKRGAGRQARAVPLARHAAGAAPLAASEKRPLAADGLLDEADGLVRQAHFEEALAKAMEAREAVPRAGDQAALQKRRARADVIAGTAQVALGKDADARASFERAVQTDPGLRLNPASTSPKVVRAFDAARAAASGEAP
jgi:hypothetical protein